MISKLHRFHRRGSLNYVYQKGQSVRSGFLSLRYAPSKYEDYRMAVVVSRKVSKSAVVRNRIRRRIYEAVRLYKIEVGVKWPNDLVITVFDERLASMTAEELQDQVRKLLGKAGL